MLMTLINLSQLYVLSHFFQKPTLVREGGGVYRSTNVVLPCTPSLEQFLSSDQAVADSREKASEASDVHSGLFNEHGGLEYAGDTLFLKRSQVRVYCRCMRYQLEYLYQ